MLFVTLYNWVLPIITMLGIMNSGNSTVETSSLSSSFNNPVEPLRIVTTKAPNVTDFVPEVEQRNLFAKIVGSASNTFIAIVGISGNCMVIYVILTDAAVKTDTQVANLFILQLALTDLMTTSCVCIPGAVVFLLENYTFGAPFCLLWASSNLLGFINTIVILQFISIDRFIAVGWSLHYPQWVTYDRMIGACIYIWASGTLAVIGWDILCPFDYDFWSGFCDISWDQIGPDAGVPFVYAISQTLWYFITPSITILVCNVLIINMSKEKGRVGKVKDAGADDESKVNPKILKAMMIVILSYFILTFPAGLFKVLRVLGGKNGPVKYIPGWLLTTVALLQLSASIVNPFIYGIFRKDFRDAFGRIWKRIRSN